MNIDWALLRKQKQTLLGVIAYLEAQKVTLLIEDLQGIVHLIDGLQDEAVDSGEAPEAKVFGPDTDNDEFKCDECGGIFDIEESFKVGADLLCKSCHDTGREIHG